MARFPPGWSEDDEDRYQEARGESGGRIGTREQVQALQREGRARSDEWKAWFDSLPEGAQLHYNGGFNDIKGAIKVGDTMKVVAMIGNWTGTFERDLENQRRNPNYPFDRPKRFGGRGTIFEHPSYLSKYADPNTLPLKMIVGRDIAPLTLADIETIRKAWPEQWMVLVADAPLDELKRRVDRATSAGIEYRAPTQGVGRRSGYEIDEMRQILREHGRNETLAEEIARAVPEVGPFQLRDFFDYPAGDLARGRHGIELERILGSVAARVISTAGVAPEIRGTFADTIDAYQRSWRDTETRRSNARHIIRAIATHPGLRADISSEILTQAEADARQTSTPPAPPRGVGTGLHLATRMTGLGIHTQQVGPGWPAAGRWFLVGTVPARASYEHEDESPLTDADIAAVRQAGPGFAKVRRRTFETEAEALAAAEREMTPKAPAPSRGRSLSSLVTRHSLVPHKPGQECKELGCGPGRKSELDRVESQPRVTPGKVRCRICGKVGSKAHLRTHEAKCKSGDCGHGAAQKALFGDRPSKSLVSLQSAAERASAKAEESERRQDHREALTAHLLAARAAEAAGEEDVRWHHEELAKRHREIVG